MKRWSRYFVLAAGVGLVAAVMSLTTAGPAIAERAFAGVMTFIVNDDQNPVPVKNVEGLTIASVSGVVPTQSAGAPFQQDVTLGPALSLLFSVPANSRALIRHVSGSCTAEDGAVARYIAVDAAVPNQGNLEARHIFPLAASAANQWVFAQETFIHAYLGVIGAVASSPALATISCRVTFSGELFPLE